MPVFAPIKLNKKRRDQLAEWLQEQLYQTIGDRQVLDTKWENALIQSRAQKPEGTIDFPFVGASNEEFPLTDMHFQPVYADFYQTLHAPEDYFAVTAKRPDRTDHANVVRQALTAIEKKYLKMRRVNSTALLDMITLGTSIYKNHWYERRYNRKDYLPDGTIGDVTRRISEPRVEHIPLQNFYFPAKSWSLDPDAQGGTPWQAQKLLMTPPKFREWSRGSETLPGFSKKDVEEVENWVTDEHEPVLSEIREEDEYVPFEDRTIKLYEVWCRFDVNDDGIDEDLVVIFHLDTKRILRILHNPLMHGKWPFKATKYLPWWGIYGRGLAEVDEWAQDSLTKLLNAQLDNVLLANTRMYSAPLGSNIQPGEPVYPSKIWFVGPNEKVGEIRMSDIYSSMPNVISQIMQFSEMRTGVSEIKQGNITGLPSRTPATSLLAILQEGNKRFDMVLSAFRDVHSEIGIEIVQNLLQHTKEDPLRWETFFTQSLGKEDAALLGEVLNDGIFGLEESFGVAVSATSAQVNKEVEKQSFIGLMQIVSQIYGQLVQTAMLMSQVQDPMVLATAQAAYSSGTELLKRLLERFDIQNPSEYLPNLGALAQGGAQMPGMAQQQQAGGLGIQGQAGGIPPQILQQQQLGQLFGL
jgi:hypothetical protein